MHNPPPILVHYAKDRGFALIVTLSLMILLTVIAVGLLSLSSITLRGTSVSSARQTAQANARMAMMLAIAQLQKYAGPDQRITATADIAGGAGGIAAADGAAPLNGTALDGTTKGLSSVQAGTRHWTGVWKNRDASSLIYTKTPAPQQLQWLVSGNEAIPNAVTPASNAYSLGANGSVQNSTTAVVLVGGKTDGNKTTDPNYYVSAPLVNILGSGATPKPVGRYGWWVGDEGVKAKINLVAPYAKDELATFKNVSSQRSGWEAVNDLKGNALQYPLPGSTGSASLSGVTSLPQVSLIASGAIPRDSLLFHAATADSYGVLADVLQGGLRLDLTSYLRTLPTSSPLAYPNGIIAGANIIPTTVAPSIKGPKWKALKDFSEFPQNMSGGSIITKPAATVNDAAIAPTIIELRLLLGARMVPAPGAVDSYKVHPCAKIAVVLANPYSYPLRWTNGIDIEIKNALPFSPVTYHPSRIFYYIGPGAYETGGAFVPIAANGVSSEAAVFNNTIFRIPAGSLPVGGATAYTISAPTTRTAGSVAQVVVPLGAINASNALAVKNFDNVIELDDGGIRNLANVPNCIGLDLREDKETSQINIEMRPANSALILRKLERFELDNANYEPTMLCFTTPSKMSNFPNGQIAIGLNKYDVLNIIPFTRPVPLQLYRFQMSQPGENYVNLMSAPFAPNPSNLGLTCSTLRTFADFNLQATRFRKPIMSYNPPPFFMSIADNTAAIPTGTSGGDAGKFALNLADQPISWGRGRGSAGGESEKTVLFCPPAPGETMVSLAQFQHADLTADDIYTSVGHQPGNAFGNSYATPFVTRDKTVLSRKDYLLTGEYQAAGLPNQTIVTATNYYDISYLLNASVWDTYFCSTIPSTATTAPLNLKIVKADPADESNELREGEKSSSRLLVNGAFNINSTSKDAWKAFLAGSKHLRHPADATDSSDDALFPRSLGQKSPSVITPSGSVADSFSGYRRLNNDQLDRLAETMTKQVRLRGPFVSLSHFVNRALVGFTTNKDLGRSGALQSAIDLSGANIKPDSSNSIFGFVTAINDKVTLQTVNDGPRADLDTIRNAQGVVVERETNIKPTTTWPSWPQKSRDGNPGAVSSILADKPMLTGTAIERDEQGFRSTGIPGWLTQADILQVIGPSIAARSDTFKIRSYGEALDASGNVTARAWCEACVQRVPEYVDATNRAYDRDIQSAPLGSVNKRFGRQFKCMSFRWLSSDEI